MLEDVLLSVKQTEAEAADLVSAAEEKATAALKKSQQQIAADWVDIKARAKAQRAARLEEAEAHAEAAARHIADDYAAQCAVLHKAGLSQVNDLVDYLTEIIFNGSC